MVTNFSFESPDTGGGVAFGDPPGWTGNSATSEGVVAMSSNAAYPPATDGSQAAFLEPNDNFIQQPTTFANSTTYTLKVDFAGVVDVSDYDVAILSPTNTILADMPGIADNTSDPRWTTVTVVYTTSAASPFVGQNLGIEIMPAPGCRRYSTTCDWTPPRFPSLARWHCSPWARSAS